MGPQNKPKVTMRKCLSSAVVFLIAVGQTAPVLAKKIKIPENRVIAEYAPRAAGAKDANPAMAEAGLGPVAAFTPADEARLGVISGYYPQTIKLMKGMLEDIRANSPDKSINPSVKLFNSERPEARAISRSLVVVSTGFFDVLAKEFPDPQTQSDALAFVLAHEYAHLLYDHPDQYPERQEQLKISNYIGQGYSVLKTAESLNEDLGARADVDFAGAEKGFLSASAASPWIDAELYRAVYAPYRREQEQLADFMAVDLISDPNNAGSKFDARSGAAPIRAIYKAYDNSIKGQLESLQNEADETLSEAAVELQSVSHSLTMTGDATLLPNMMKDWWRRKWTGFVRKKAQARLKNDDTHLYYSSDSRVDAIDEYADKFYPKKADTASTALLKLFGVAKAYSLENSPAAAAAQAIKFLARGDVAGARKALDGETDKSRFTYLSYLMASGDVAFAERRFGPAIEVYRQVIRRNDAPPRSFSSLSHAHFRAGNKEKAVEALDLGVKKFSAEDYIIEKIDLLINLGRNEDALAALEQCRALGDQDLALGCEEAAAPILPKKKGLVENVLDGVKSAIPIETE